MGTEGMTPIERVRAVLSAGTPGPLRGVQRAYRRAGLFTPDDSSLGYIHGRNASENARKLALAVNLAPLFVALWDAVETWAKALNRTSACRDEFGWNEVGVQACAEWQDAEDTAALAVVKALAALNEAATREVGE